jgi:tricarballylate dehydrogenase
MPPIPTSVDVLVAGGGNAALCAALSAREAGASVLVLESAPRTHRGGNSRHTRNLRCMHTAPTSVLTDAYPEDEYFQDLLRVTGGQTDEPLARLAIRRSGEAQAWLLANGVRFQSSFGGTLHLGRTNAFFLGGGKALMNRLYDLAAERGIDVRYETEVLDVEMDGPRVTGVVVRAGGTTTTVRPKAFVAACGGFESNLEWLREAWGPPADNFLIRGTPYNRGVVLKALMNRGVKTIGDPTQGHMVAIDARAPKFDGGIITRLDCVSLGIVVNRRAERFYDEGEDFWPKRYAIWGRLVAQQPEQIAYSIVDSKAIGRFMPSVFDPVKAQSLPELAQLFDLDPDALVRTVKGFNAAVRPGTFDHSVLDDCRTQGLAPDKTHWALPIDTPPFYGYPLRCGVTFTYLGVKVNAESRALMADGTPCANLFAAGEIMAGNVLGKGYLAGIGMTIGTVFGRLAGQSAGAQVTGRTAPQAEVAHA